MAAALNDFDGLAKTKHLLANDATAAWQVTNYSVAAPDNTTGWFIPATGQWLAIFCSPGLGGAKMPDANGAFYQKFNVNPATQINKAMREQGGSDLRDRTWTSSAYWATTGIYFSINLAFDEALKNLRNPNVEANLSAGADDFEGKMFLDATRIF